MEEYLPALALRRGRGDFHESLLPLCAFNGCFPESSQEILHSEQFHVLNSPMLLLMFQHCSDHSECKFLFAGGSILPEQFYFPDHANFIFFQSIAHTVPLDFIIEVNKAEVFALCPRRH